MVFWERFKGMSIMFRIRRKIRLWYLSMEMLQYMRVVQVQGKSFARVHILRLSSHCCEAELHACI